MKEEDVKTARKSFGKVTAAAKKPCQTIHFASLPRVPESVTDKFVFATRIVSANVYHDSNV